MINLSRSGFHHSIMCSHIGILYSSIGVYGHCTWQECTSKPFSANTSLQPPLHSCSRVKITRTPSFHGVYFNYKGRLSIGKGDEASAFWMEYDSILLGLPACFQCFPFFKENFSCLPPCIPSWKESRI